VAVDATGSLFIADVGNNVIRKVGSNGIITTVAGNGTGAYSGDGGAATNAELSHPQGVVVDTTGNLFIADYFNNRVRKVVFPGPTLVLNDVGVGNAGAYDVVVSNPYGSVTSSVVNLTVIAPLQITTTSLPNGTNGVAYNQTLAAFGGQTPYSWTNISGVLPPGLTLATNGVISGTPTTNGTNNFTVQVTDANNNTAMQALALTVVGPPIVAIQPTNSSVTVPVGANMTFSVSVAGTGPFSYQWQLNGNNLNLSSVADDIITTVAGGYLGDGGPATNAALNVPKGTAVDVSGNLYIADSDNNLIRRVDTKGIITTVAGNGIGGYSGDSGAATNAELSSPSGVAVDATGNLFIADTGNAVIRKVGTNGILTTVAGNGNYDYSGDGGAATNAELWSPSGVAVDATGNLFIADAGNAVIRKVGTNGIIITVAGNGTGGYSGDGGAATNAELNWSSGVAVDATGNLFIADQYNNRIRKVDTNGIITTVAGNGSYFYSGDGGAATNAELGGPSGVAVDVIGNLFIADSGNQCIRRVDTKGIITTVAGIGTYYGYSGDGGAATNAELGGPSGVAVDTFGNLFIADSGNDRIREVGRNGVITTVAGGYLGDGGPATNASLNYPKGTTLHVSGNLFIADSGNQRIRKVDTKGIIATVAGNGITVYSGDGGPATNASLSYPSGVAVDTSGNLFIADSQNNRIREVGTNGIITTVAGGGDNYPGDGGAATNAELNNAIGVAVDATGNLFIADQYNNRIRKVGTSGIITTVAGNGYVNPITGQGGYSGDGGAATNAELYWPSGVAVDATGNLFIADAYNERIREVGTNGIIFTVAGDGTQAYSGDGGAATNAQFNNPSGLAVDAIGNLFIADSGNYVIREVGTNGIINTVAGNGTWGCSGDGGAATNAELWSPSGVAVDATGNLFIADSQNNRIRKVAQGPTLVLNDVGLGNTGAYDVVVSSPYGSVTSSVVSLTVTLPVVLSAPQLTGSKTNFTFVLSGPAGSNYVLQVSTNLLNWSPVGTSTIPVSGSITLSNAISGYNRLFYRAYLQ